MCGKVGMLERPSIQIDHQFQTQFDEQVRAAEVLRMKELSLLADRNEVLGKDLNKIQNLSVKAILGRTLQVMIDILDDVMQGVHLQGVFSGPSGDRPLYIGLVLVALAMGLYAIDLTA